MSNDLTLLLTAAAGGDRRAAADLLPLMYAELRSLAAAKMAAEAGGQTLQATALVHEAYLRIIGTQDPQAWDGRGHFFAAAAEAMRRILVDNARRKKRLRHGGDRKRFLRRYHGKICWPWTPPSTSSAKPTEQRRNLSNCVTLQG